MRRAKTSLTGQTERFKQSASQTISLNRICSAEQMIMLTLHCCAGACSSAADGRSIEDGSCPNRLDAAETDCPSHAGERCAHPWRLGITELQSHCPERTRPKRPVSVVERRRIEKRPRKAAVACGSVRRRAEPRPRARPERTQVSHRPTWCPRCPWSQSSGGGIPLPGTR